MPKNSKLCIKKLRTTVALSSGKQIESIVSILKSYFNITHYCYIKSFKNGSHILLSNDSPWIENFYLDFYEHGAFHKIPQNYNSGHMLWCNAQDQTTFNVCRENFNIAHGITIIENQKTFCEFYCFGTTRDNQKLIDFYLNNLDLLERFNAFFKEQASTLIEKAYADRLILPQCHTITSDKISINTAITNLNELRKNFINATQCKRYYLSGMHADMYLTARELDCLNLVTFGKPTKEVASILGISTRTVETHLNAVKDKFGTASKARLITKSLQYNQYKLRNENQFVPNIATK